MDRREMLKTGGMAALCGLLAREAQAQGFVITGWEAKNVVLAHPHFEAEFVAHTTAPAAPLLSMKTKSDSIDTADGTEWTANFEFTGITVMTPNEIPVKMHVVCKYGKDLGAGLREVDATVAVTFASGRMDISEYTPSVAASSIGKHPTDANALIDHFQKQFAQKPYTRLFMGGH